jgi:hypothetical protein
VELILKNGKDLLAQEHLDVLKTELDAVLKEFAPLLKKPEKPKPSEIFDKDKAKELLELLEPLLRSGNPSSLGFIEDLRPLPGSEKLIKQIEDFDFKPAVSTLAELMGKIE